MLCQYSVKNFKSIKDEITLNMEALDISEYSNSLIEYGDGEKYLPLSAIYGPNGGGKSNVLNSLFFLLYKITAPVNEIFKNEDNNKTIKKNESKTVPYKFDEKTINEPSEFDIFCRDDKYEYHYQAAIFSDNFIEEHLARKNIKSNKYINIFSRDENSIRFYGSLYKYNSNDFIKEISKDLSLISYLRITHNENSVVKSFFSLLQYGIITIDNTSNFENRFYRYALMTVDKIGDTHSKILNMMKEMDIDIDDYAITEENDLKQIYVKHMINGKEKLLNINEESTGTKKIAGLLAYVNIALNLGSTLVIDELDCNIHPKLLGYIINLFSDKKINKKGAQLIFTSHDLITMSSTYFRRDEIWFAAKNSEESSYLYSLSEFKKDNGKNVRKDEVYNKQYLEGRYGSDPYLRKIIEW